MLLIMIPDQYPNYYKTLEIYTGYYDTFILSQQYRNNERLLYSIIKLHLIKLHLNRGEDS